MVFHFARALVLSRSRLKVSEEGGAPKWALKGAHKEPTSLYEFCTLSLVVFFRF
jgi:hypothetical protein